MITVLIVAPPRRDLAELEGRDPSIEILFARDGEEALEKLGRNRRIDAVLLLDSDPEETARAVFEDNPAAPPIFAPVASSPVPPITPLSGRDPGELLAEIVGKLSG